MGSGPKAIRFHNGTIMVFARGTDRQYYQTTMTDVNEFSDWVSISDLTFTSPPVAIVNPSGQVLVFGTHAETHTTWYAETNPISDGTLTFGEFANLGQESTGTPAVVVDSEALLHVLIRGTNRGLWHLAEKYEHPASKSWGEWECLGGVMASGPNVPVSLNGVGLVEVYGRAADKALWHRSQTAQQYGSSVDWAGWTSLGGVLASGPAVVSSDDGTSTVFARATDKAIYFKNQFEDETGSVHFSQWSTLGGMFSTTPLAVVRTDGLFDIFARGVDKAIWHSRQVEVNGTRTYTSWHSLGGHTRKFSC
jgi:hypothetical protein